MKAYKLTDEHSCTKNNTQWGTNITHSISPDKTNPKLCSDSWIHFYTSPLVAVLMNPVHANFANPILWECETAGEHVIEPIKAGCKQLTTLRQISLPVFTTTQRAAFSILCAQQVCKDPNWNKWAEQWLTGADRTEKAAVYAYAANAAAYAAYAANAANAANAYANANVYAAYANAAQPLDFHSLALKALEIV